MKAVSIDLAEPGPCCDAPVELKKTEKWYPTLHISSDEEMDLPEEGKMIVTFRRKRKEEVTDDQGERYNCTLEIRSIEGVEGAKKASKRPDEEFDEAMESYMKDKEKASEDTED